MYASCLHVLLSSSRLVAANERVWLTEGNEFHLVEALAQLIESFTVSPQMVSLVDRCVELHSYLIFIINDNSFKYPGTTGLKVGL